MRDYWTQLEEFDIKCVAWQRWEWEASAPSGESHAGRVYVDTHTFQQGLNMTLMFQNGLLIYIHQGLKGPVMSAEIEVLTATLDSSWLILF